MTKTRRFSLRPLLLFAIVTLALTPMLLRLSGFTRYRIASDALSPELSCGDLAYVRTVTASETEEGEIIVFLLNRQTVAVGRVIGRSDKTHLLVADNAPEHTAFTVHEKNVLGKVVFSLPRLGFLAEFLERGSNRAVALCALAVGYVLFCLSRVLQKTH